MDVTIQSLVQSPYMRAMTVVPTRSEDLVHGIHDHLPPLVKTQVRVQPVRNSGLAGRWVFNIPRRGLWHSAQLVVRPRITTATLSQGMLSRQTSIQSTFVEAIENIELFSKQRFIERLIPEAIISEMLSHADKKLQWMQFSYADRNPSTHAAINASVPWPYVATDRMAAGLRTLDPNDSDTFDQSRPHYIIPLPLSSFTSIKKNFQTLFVEPLSIVVTSKDFGYFPTSGYDMYLNCEYHSFHPNVETVIRNANYKQEIPATLPWHDWIVFDNRVSYSSTSIEYSLESDALISKLLIIPKWMHTASKVSSTKINENVYIVIRSLSEILYEGSLLDNKNRHDLIMDEFQAPLHPDICEDEAYSTYIPIHFGLRRDKERFSGGLALSSITNPRVTIYPNEAVYRSGDTSMSCFGFPTAMTYEPYDFKIIGKRHFFLRIDSDTGVMTRSIES